MMVTACVLRGGNKGLCIMALMQFGNTWWGKEWIRAFNNIYDNNSVLKGKSYARNGCVINLDLVPGLIKAMVLGSNSKPYKVKISLPVLDQHQKEIILKIIMNNLYYLAHLVSAKLPLELNTDLVQQKIYLFPHSWESLTTSCSCADNANPCKHLAAVIYETANKIDLNPFIIFELAKFDLLTNVGRYLGISAITHNYTILSYNELICHELEDKECKVGGADLKDINFSQLPNFKKAVIDVFIPNPLFNLTNDYRCILSDHYDDLSNIVAKLPISTDINVDASLFDVKLLVIYPDLSYNMEISDYKQNHKITTVAKLIELIETVSSLNLRTNCDQIIGLYLAYNLTKSLIIAGALVPQLYKLEDMHYMLRYVPLIVDEQVSLLLQQVVAFIPQRLVSFKSGDRQITRYEQLLWLISLFTKHFNIYSDLSDHGKLLLINAHVHAERFSDASLSKANYLFLSNAIKINPKTEMDFINHIGLWLSRFYIHKTQYTIVLQVTERQQKFCLKVLVTKSDIMQAKPISLKKLLANKDIIRHVLYRLSLVIESIDRLKELFLYNNELLIDKDEFIPILFEVLPRLKLLGIKILLPKSLEQVVFPKLSIKVEQVKNHDSRSVSSFNLNEILRFNWQVNLGKEAIKIPEFKKLLACGKKMVKIKGKYIYLDKKIVANIIKIIENPIRKLTKLELLRSLLTEDNDGMQYVLSTRVRHGIDKLLSAKNISLPTNFHAELRAYQYRGYCWLYKNICLGFGSIIADDMGLGKTVQVIACILKLVQEKLISKTLVIMPTSLITNWCKELKRFAPQLDISIYHGTNRNNFVTNDITLVSYGIVRRDYEEINKQKWDLIVLDEAQNIKNVASMQTKLIKNIKAKYRIAMSGTPVENSLLEYYSIIDFINKGYFGGISQFSSQFAKPIEGRRDTVQLNKFLLATKPFVLRRLKTDKSIIQDLPKKIIIDEYCDLTEEQKYLYQVTLDDLINKIYCEDNNFTRHTIVLVLIMALKQICNHPSHYLKDFNNVNVTSSGKLMLMLDRIRDIYAANEKVIIFTQFTDMGLILQKVIENEVNTPVLFLHGKIRRKSRDQMIDLLQTSQQHKIMVLSIKAGGVGLNLTSASHVIHYDLWWNPAVENQATDRTYRIGQDKTVFVHRLVCSNSFEEKINQMIKDKQELANLTVKVGEQWLGSLTNEELGQIFSLN